MEIKQIADNVKRLREHYSHSGMSLLPEIATINFLVELVGDMAEAIANNGDISWIDTKLMLNFAAVASLKEKV